jgi:hypothetical protein
VQEGAEESAPLRAADTVVAHDTAIVEEEDRAFSHWDMVREQGWTVNDVR